MIKIFPQKDIRQFLGSSRKDVGQSVWLTLGRDFIVSFLKGNKKKESYVNLLFGIFVQFAIFFRVWYNQLGNISFAAKSSSGVPLKQGELYHFLVAMIQEHAIGVSS